MGVYDQYGDVQLKIGPCMMDQYKIGDKVPIKDGIYLEPGYGTGRQKETRAVVVRDGIFQYIEKNVRNKWGGKVTIYRGFA